MDRCDGCNSKKTGRWYCEGCHDEIVGRLRAALEEIKFNAETNKGEDVLLSIRDCADEALK